MNIEMLEIKKKTLNNGLTFYDLKIKSYG